jgi:hypothetical protein
MEWKILSDNWGVVTMAPIAFFAALCAGVAIGWIVVGLIYNQRLAHQQDVIGNLRAVLEDKLPPSVLRAAPRMRTKRMSFGLILVFVGLGASLLGALIVLFDQPSQQTKINFTGVAPPSVTALPTQNATPIPLPENKVFIDKTAHELFALYEGRTMLQADQLIEPFKGKWIEAHGKILQLIPDGTPGGTTAVLKDGEKLINCKMGARWNSRLLAFSNGEELKIIGKIGPSQNGQQLYLNECELT